MFLLKSDVKIFLLALTSVRVKIKSDSYYLLEVKGKDSAADHGYIHDIPHISQICARMEEHAQVQHFEQTFNCKDGSEPII